jgi:excinuclease ABC subunit C
MSMLDELTHLTGMDSPPGIIEAYDISNIGEEIIVGSMVVFKDARAERRDYKRFQIKDSAGVDDYAALKQVLSRRFNRYLTEQESGEGFGRLPDLLLVDGGRGHLSVALEVLDHFGLSIPVFGMVKDDRHRTRALVGPQGELALNMNRGAFSLVSAIQNEAHRFAHDYARKKHKLSSFELALQGVPGIGEKRAKALFSHFKTQKAMANATVDQLAAVPGMTRPVAQRVWDYFNGS